MQLSPNFLLPSFIPYHNKLECLSLSVTLTLVQHLLTGLPKGSTLVGDNLVWKNLTSRLKMTAITEPTPVKAPEPFRHFLLGKALRLARKH